MSLQKLIVLFVFVTVGLIGKADSEETCVDHPMCNQYSYVQIYCSHTVIKQKCRKACGLCTVQAQKLITTRSPTRKSTVAQARPATVTTSDARDARQVDPAVTEKRCQKADHPSCSTYSNKKYYCPQQWMTENCCNFCRPSPSDVVDDPSASSLLMPSRRRGGRQKMCRKPDLPMCAQYMQSGRDHYCQHHVIRKHCKRACGICTDNYNNPGNRRNNYGPAGQPAIGACPSPDIPMCRYYVQMGKEHYCTQAYMQAYCKKACSLCI